MIRISHEQVRLWIQETGLSEQKRSDLLSHLGWCKDCRAYAAMHDHLFNKLTLKPARYRATADFRENVFREVRIHERRKLIMKPIKMAAVLASLVALVFIVTFALYTKDNLQPLLRPATPVETEVVEPTSQPTATLIPTPENHDNILFVGTSLLWWNQGLWLELEGLTASADPPFTIETSDVTGAGTTLENVWDEVTTELNKANYDYVILVEYSSAILDRDGYEAFYGNFQRYNEEIEAAGAQTVLFLEWELNFEGDWTWEEIVEAYRQVGAELDIKIAPVGLAWQRALQERPDFELYDSDQTHQTIKGDYLNACVIYATIYEQSPVGLSFQPADRVAGVEALEYKYNKWLMTEDEVAFLQRIAWETVSAFYGFQD